MQVLRNLSAGRPHFLEFRQIALISAHLLFILRHVGYPSIRAQRDRDVNVVVARALSEGTMRETASHVKFFRQYLEHIRGKTPDESAKWHQMTETQLVFHMKEFFSGIKKRSDGTDLQPSYYWNIFSSLQRQLKIENGRGSMSQSKRLSLRWPMYCRCNLIGSLVLPN